MILLYLAEVPKDSLCLHKCGTVGDSGSLKFIAVSPLFLQKYRDCEDAVQLLNDGSVWMISDQRFKTIKAVVSYHSELAPNHKRTNKSTI